MYKIDSKVVKPNIRYMESEVKKMMQRGINVADIVNLYSRFANERDSLQKEITNSYGILNANSSQQIIKFLSNLDNAEVYEECCIDGKWTTNKDALGNLSLLGYQFATDILDYRKAKKYAETIKSIKDAVGEDGRIHPEVSLAKTNRINYSSPALMNIPKPLLWHIIKPNRDGDILISADIKNQEPSILINILGAEHLKEALIAKNGLYEHLFSIAYKAKAKLNFIVTNNYREGYISNTELASLGYVPPAYYMPSIPSVVSTYYKDTQVRVIDCVNVVVRPGTPLSKIKLPDKILVELVNNTQAEVGVTWDLSNIEKKLNKEGIVETTGELSDIDVRCEGIYRKEFKTAWLAMTYGAGSFGIEQMCKHIDGKAFYNYFSKIPEMQSYKYKCTKMADKMAQNIGTYFGTVLFADEPNPKKLKRVLMDLPVQGTAADILSILIRHCNDVISQNGLEDKLEIYYTRHDEMIFEVSKSWVEEIGIDNVLSFIRDITEHKIDDWVPFKVEVEELKAGKLYLDTEDDEIFK